MPNAFDIASIPREKIPALVSALMMRLLEPEEPSTVAVAPVADGGDDEWLTVAEAAKLLRCSPKTLYRKAEHMPCCRRNGRTLLFNKAGLTKWLARQKV